MQVQNPARGRGRGNGERITPGYSNCVSAEWSFGGQARVREAADDPGCATAVGIDARAVVVPGYGSAARGDGRGLTHLLRQAVKVAERIRNWDTGTRPLKQHSLGRKSLHRGACILTQTSMHCGGSICRTSCACPGSAGWAVSPRPRCPEPGNRYLEWRNCRRPLPTPGPCCTGQENVRMSGRVCRSRTRKCELLLLRQLYAHRGTLRHPNLLSSTISTTLGAPQSMFSG